ncbi:MAG: ornithine carbamoyltransferase [Candidatus Omnitrophica bacterium]|nr:ornithine carbamoyltransferase [Candidatus Omnitrophota bacterium]
MNSLISIADLQLKDINKIFTLAGQMKRNPSKFHNALHRKKFALIFEKPSTRTWVSFDVGIHELGGGAIYLGPDDIKMGVREEVRDIARVLNRYMAGVILRTFSHQTITEFQKYFTKPVINGLSDYEHPCQALADYLTIREKFPKKKKPVFSFIGDGNNVLASLLLLTAKLGGVIRYATPKTMTPDKQVIAQARKIAVKTGAIIEGYSDPKKAVKNADVIYTDVWVSMGEEKIRKQKMKAFKGMQVNQKLISMASKSVIVMHCLPAHRGEEITDDVMEGKHSVVFDQAENRLHIQKAVLLYLCKK